MQDQQRDQQIIFSPEGRYLSLHGSFIDQLGSQSNTLTITEECFENRRKRDGNKHHITVMNHLEISTFISNETNEEVTLSRNQQKKLFKKAQSDTYNILKERFGPASDWELPVDLGTGRCAHQGAISYFRVIHWPFGQLMRGHLGLKRSNFHITVGFSPHDVHLYKGPASLICLQPGQPCSRETMNKLVGLAYFYAEDNSFIKALYKTSWRHGYYKQLFYLTIARFAFILKYIKRKLSRKEDIRAPTPTEVTPLISVTSTD